MNKWLLLLTFFFLSSCIDPPPPRLSKVSKKELDSLYSASKDSLNLLADEICDENHASIYHAAIDSFQNLHREDIERLREQ